MIQLGIAAALSCLLFAEYMRRKTRSIEENILEKVESMLAEVNGGVCSECKNRRVTRRVTGAGTRGRRVEDVRPVAKDKRKRDKKKKRVPGLVQDVSDDEESFTGNHHHHDDDAMLHRTDDILDIGSDEDEQEDGWLIHVE